MARSAPVGRQWACMTSLWFVIALLSLLGPTLCRGEQQGQRPGRCGVSRNTEPLMMRSSLKMYRGVPESAHHDFAAAVRLSPRDPDAHFFVALSDYNQDKFAVAASELRSAIGSGIVDSDLHYLLAECAIRLDPTKPLDALPELNRAIEIDAKSVSARTLRGKLLLQGGHPREAVADLPLGAYDGPGLS